MNFRELKCLGLIFMLTLCASVKVFSQTVGLKTNMLYWGTATINLGAETKIADKLTTSLSLGYNPFSLSDGGDGKFKHISVLPELRYWTCAPYSGHFFAANLFYSHFNAGGIKLPLGIFPSLEDYRYQGDIGGIGASYGYNFILAPRVSLEFETGIGLYYAVYGKYKCYHCGSKVGSEKDFLVMPSKIAFNLVVYL